MAPVARAALDVVRSVTAMPDPLPRAAAQAAEAGRADEDGDPHSGGGGGGGGAGDNASDRGVLGASEGAPAVDPRALAYAARYASNLGVARRGMRQSISSSASAGGVALLAEVHTPNHWIGDFAPGVGHLLLLAEYCVKRWTQLYDEPESEPAATAPGSPRRAAFFSSGTPARTSSTDSGHAGGGGGSSGSGGGKSSKPMQPTAAALRGIMRPVLIMLVSILDRHVRRYRLRLVAEGLA